MVEFSVEFFKERGITADKISRANLTCHSEGHQDGIASNHGDPFHWLGKHGYSMEGMRMAVKTELSKSGTATPTTPTAPATDGKLYRVQVGAYSVKSNADAMLKKAKAAGFADAFIKHD
jgi:hypothetical protein